MKLRSYLCVLFCCVASAAASADENGDLKQKAKILNRRLGQNGTTLHRTLKIFYSRAVICFQDNPRQARGYPANFDFCLKRVAARVAAPFVRKVQDSPLPPGRRLAKLDAAFLDRSQGETGLAVYALTMVNQDLLCLEQHSMAVAQLESCVHEAAQKNLDGLVETFGEPGAGGSLDLAVIDRDTPRVHYVARFNDLGKYYRMPHAPGLPPGQYRNPGIPPPLFPAINYPVLIRNGVISSALFGKPAFGDYRRP